jgi:preprotein translocase subunit SecD
LKRKRYRVGILVALTLCASPVLAADLVFEGGEQRLEAEIAEASPVYKHGAASISVRLRASSAAAFAKLTTSMVGEQLVVSLCGNELLRPVVREPLVGGQAIINMPDIQHAIAVAEVLQGEADCDRLEELFVE